MTIHPAIQAAAAILAIIAGLAALFVIPLGLDPTWQIAFDGAAGLLGGIAAGTALITWHDTKDKP